MYTMYDVRTYYLRSDSASTFDVGIFADWMPRENKNLENRNVFRARPRHVRMIFIAAVDISYMLISHLLRSTELLAAPTHWMPRLIRVIGRVCASLSSYRIRRRWIAAMMPTLIWTDKGNALTHEHIRIVNEWKHMRLTSSYTDQFYQLMKWKTHLYFRCEYK